jgi:hypothetical protein
MQEYVNVIYNEGRIDELLNACDYYHPEMPTSIEAFEWGLTLGQYMGKFHYGSSVYRFQVLGGRHVLYFIGTKESVKARINKVL